MLKAGQKIEAGGGFVITTKASGLNEDDTFSFRPGTWDLPMGARLVSQDGGFAFLVAKPVSEVEFPSFRGLAMVVEGLKILPSAD